MTRHFELVLLSILLAACSSVETSPTGPDPAEMTASELFNGESPLYLVHFVEREDCAGLRTAKSEGAEIDVKGHGGASLLYYALREGYVSAFRCLIELGADVDQYLDQTPLISIAASQQDTAFLEALLAGGANPNSRSRVTGRPALFSAVMGGQRNVELLLEYGGDPNVEVMSTVETEMFPMEGMTAIMTSAAIQNPDILSYLLDHGADICARDSAGRTLSHYLDVYDWSKASSEIQHFIEGLKRKLADC